MASNPTHWGLLAEFEDPAALVQAVRQTREEGYRKVDAFTPFPVEELSEALGFHNTGMPTVMLLGGIIGGVGGFILQWWCMAVDYPLNVGGRPLNSWPAWIPVTFELTVLVSALAGVFGLLALCGLPTPHHPLFGVPSFDKVTRDGFFMTIQANDSKFDLEATRQFLTRLGAREVTEVPYR